MAFNLFTFLVCILQKDQRLFHFLAFQFHTAQCGHHIILSHILTRPITFVCSKPSTPLNNCSFYPIHVCILVSLKVVFKLLIFSTKTRYSNDVFCTLALCSHLVDLPYIIAFLLAIFYITFLFFFFLGAATIRVVSFFFATDSFFKPSFFFFLFIISLYLSFLLFSVGQLLRVGCFLALRLGLTEF